MQFDKFLSNLFFINVTIRECNFAMGKMLEKGFAHALVLVQNHFPILSPAKLIDLYALNIHYKKYVVGIMKNLLLRFYYLYKYSIAISGQLWPNWANCVGIHT